MDANRQRILTVIAQIPPGKVATYGQIASLAGLPRRARLVGRVLKTCADPKIPWYRVVNSRGEISLRSGSECQQVQYEALLEEGVEFDIRRRIDLSRFQWHPDPLTP